MHVMSQYAFSYILLTVSTEKWSSGVKIAGWTLHPKKDLRRSYCRSETITEICKNFQLTAVH